MAATYQRISDGRLLLNIVTGGEPAEQARFGDHLDPRRSGTPAPTSSSTVCAAPGTQAPFDFAGEHFHGRGRHGARRLDPLPELYFGGSSAPAGPVAAKHADVYLTWGEPPEQVAEKIDVDARPRRGAGPRRCGSACACTRSRATPARRRGSTRSGCSTGSTRPTIAKAQEALRRQRVGRPAADALAARRAARRSPTPTTSRCTPNLWSGVGLVRGGAGTALVGSHEEVAARIEEYAALGIDEFILSGYPHVEEAYWFAEGVMPVLRRRGLLVAAPGTPANRLTA